MIKAKRSDLAFLAAFGMAAVLCVACDTASTDAEEEITVDTDVYYIGQTCDHDDSYTEPVVPDGKYYPNGDINADYYIEIADNTVSYRNSDGSCIEDFVWNGQEFKVITQHYADDSLTLSYIWDEYTDEEIAAIQEDFPNFSGKYIISGCYSNLKIEDGVFKIAPYPANEKLTADFTDGVYCTAT